MAAVPKEKLVASAIKRLHMLEAAVCMDPIDTTTRPTMDQQKVFDALGKVSYRYVVAGNQTGKSQMGARETSWVFEENHPTWSRPTRWANEPLVMLVVGRTTKQVEEVLWRKISSFLDKSKYKITRTGGAIQKVTHENGNVIIFASHHNESEAREKLQAFVAHYVWIDEMPGSFKLIEELQRRTQSRGGYFLATFTPKVRNDEIRKVVDASKPPYSAKFRMNMFDNPVLTDEDKEKLTDEFSSYPEAYRNTLLYGDWSLGEQAVYDFQETHKADRLGGYSKGWRHVLAVDPAMSSKLGMTLWAEDPVTELWYCVRSEYISNITAPSDYVEAVEAKVRGYNIVRRISDSEPWYVGAASKLGYTYMGIYRKTERKKELIKNVQTALTEGKIKIASWCTDLIDEFLSCQWSETVEGKIVNAQRFHLLDSVQYFNDNKPKPSEVRYDSTHAERMLEAHNKRKAREAAASKPRKTGRIKRRGRKWKQSAVGSFSVF